MADGAGTPRSEPTARGVALDPRLMLWLSPAFPVGAFAFSHGLEQAAARDWLRDAATLETWLRDLLQHGSLRNDLILLSAAWRAVSGADFPALCVANDLALAMQPSSERHLETRTQGNAFLITMITAWPCPGLVAIRAVLDGDVAYPVAVGATSAAHGVPIDAVLTAYALAFAGNLVSAAIRLSVIGQTDGQRVLAELLPEFTAAAATAIAAMLDDLGNATFRADVAQLAHETQYSRLFRS